ncbi:MAG: hypothetical protein FWF46_03630 [Oscillospiraceae bacterium]|nr:hypothetical protein [Oscillospiraceae bacterium]
MEKIEPFLKLKPKFNLLYMLLSKHIGTIIVLIFFGALIIPNGGATYFFMIIVIYALYVIISLLISKYRIERTAYLFFEKQLVILKKYGNRREVKILYKDIDNMYLSNPKYFKSYFQTYLQKYFHMGDILIRLKNKNFLINQVKLGSLVNIEKVVEDLVHIIYNK